MAYNVAWDPKYPEQCREKAEIRALNPGQTWGNGFLYRLVDQSYAYIIPYADPISGEGQWARKLVVELIAFPVRNWTPKGAQIYDGNQFSGVRFVNLTATKTFACKTVDEALTSFIARKTKQARIYRARADKADRAIELASLSKPHEFLPK